MTISTATKVDPFHDFWLTDYCEVCMALGCDRRQAMLEPDAVTWHGGRSLICRYQCCGCGHEWTRADLWDAQSAGFDPTQKRKSA